MICSRVDAVTYLSFVHLSRQFVHLVFFLDISALAVRPLFVVFCPLPERSLMPYFSLDVSEILGGRSFETLRYVGVHAYK